MLTKLKAWYWRNFKYKNQKFKLKFDRPTNELFDLFSLVTTGSKDICIYIGKDQFIYRNFHPDFM